MTQGDISFGQTESRREIRQIGSFVDAHPGDYGADNREWNHGVNMPSLKCGQRTGFGFWVRRELGGGQIIKPTETATAKQPNTAYLKFFRIAAMAGRGVGSFMITQTPFLAVQSLENHGLLDRSADTLTIQLDTRAGSAAESFFEHAGFRVDATEALYRPDVLDSIMLRTYDLNRITT